MDYSPWSSKNLIDWNQLKKFMHVGVDVKRMLTNFGGRGLSGFGDLVLFNFLALLVLLSLYRTILESCCSMTDH